MSRQFRSNEAIDLPWKELPPKGLGNLINEYNSYLRAYKIGECSVIVTREYGKWHMSIAHPNRYPTWDECAQARYKAIPDNIWMAMILPPSGRYINMNTNCF